MGHPPTHTCPECGQPLYVGQPMKSHRGSDVHVGCAVLGQLRSQYGTETLRRLEKLPKRYRPAA
jgi:hypothetical protein